MIQPRKKRLFRVIYDVISNLKGLVLCHEYGSKQITVENSFYYGEPEKLLRKLCTCELKKINTKLFSF